MRTTMCLVPSAAAFLILFGVGSPVNTDTLSVKAGLAWWLDARQLESAWRGNGKPTLVSGDHIDVWFDQSGNGLHFLQQSRECQPEFQTLRDGRPIVRFDGKDDCLGRTALNREVEAFTLCLVAAPHSNAGGFRGLVAAHQTGRNDYAAGFTVDLGPAATDQFQSLNVEGKGFGGARSLMTRPVPFDEFHVISITCEAGENHVRLYVDGQLAGQRPRSKGPMNLDHLLLGARCYSNTTDPPHLQGFFHGAVAEVLFYTRVLDAGELQSIHGYLQRKHAGLSQALAEHNRGHLLKPEADPPPLQMLVPGFTVDQLPVKLTNVNNVRYRADGKLVALTYGGDVFVLSDTDGDGLEDRAEQFWEGKGRLRGPIGMALTPASYRHGDGLFIASKGKLSLIVDTDHDGRADKEMIVAEGWKEIEQNVDALGVALGSDGSIYFGLGTTNYANGYLLNNDGRSGYDIKSERGTILKVSPDFRKREVVCTGIRFPVALAFNQNGDLFATDQEGATWLPNGNPFDELLHIQPGRHYGFPPRHPKHLPNVIDEPSVCDYGPQHQSTCGLAFNQPVHGGPIFGPTFWTNDALVCGESRGKLFRTKLVKTANGYVAQNHVLACLNMLTVDACVSPHGDLVVSVHSGPPDWGTGPQGKGKLYKIRYRYKDSPQPVFAWAAGPSEVRIAFDRPLDPQQLQDVAKDVEIECGAYVRAGDRFETLKPPYAIVQRQWATRRNSVPVLSTRVSPDRRTLILATGKHHETAHYAVSLRGWKRPTPTSTELPQRSAIDLTYDLTGTEAAWKPKAGDATWSGWLPHADLTVVKGLTETSAEHARLWQLLGQPGILTLRTQLDLSNVLRPKVQQGSEQDYTPDPEAITVTFRATAPMNVKSPSVSLTSTRLPSGGTQTQLTLSPKRSELIPVEIELETGAGRPTLDVWLNTADDSRPRALQLSRFLVPWAAAKPQPEETLATRDLPELKSGDWLRGREVFFSDAAACSKCHQLGGRGGRIGPDLSNLIHRDYESVLRDITDPSAALNPEYLSYMVELQNGRLLTGVPRTVDNKLVIGDSSGNEITVEREQIAAMQAASLSAMPEGIAKTLGPDRLRDLMTYLLTEPLSPAPISTGKAPPPRRRAEIEAVLGQRDVPTSAMRKRHIVLVAGPKDHGPGEHDYPLWQRRWERLLSLADNVTTSTADGWPTPHQWKTADVIVMYSANPAWNEDRAKELDAYLERGGGLVLLHFAVNGREDVEALAERIGLAWRGGFSRYRHGPLEVTFPQGKHLITSGFTKAQFVDESYWQLVGDPKKVEILAGAVEEGQSQPLMWTHQHGKGRVFVSILGHYTWTFDDPLFRILVLRGMAWTANEPADRWTDLATIGARLGLPVTTR